MKTHELDIAEGRDLVYAGDRLFVAAGTGLVRVDGKTPTLVMPFKWGATRVAAMPDGQHVITDDARKIHIVEVASGRSVMQWSTTGEGPSCIAPSPQGARVVVAGGDEGGTLKCQAFGIKRAERTWGSLRYAQVAWLDESRFVTASTPHARTHLQLHGIDGAPPVRLGELKQVEGIACLGDRLLVGTPAGVKWVALEPAAGAASTTLWWEGPMVHALAAHAGGVLVGTEAGVFRIDAGGRGVTLAPDHAIAVTTDGERVAFVREDGGVVLLR